MFSILPYHRTRYAARRAVRLLIPLLGLLLGVMYSSTASAAPVRVMTTGLGAGTVTSSPTGINCGSTCDRTFTGTVVLTAVASTGSTFVRWLGDCIPPSGGTSATCSVDASVDSSVRAEFRRSTEPPTIISFKPEDLATYLVQNPSVNSAARFLAALPVEFRRNWMLMSRSESLQTGTAEVPRIMVTSTDAKQVFTFGLAQHESYPGSHPDAIEYMQYDDGQKNFRFHEVILGTIPAVTRAMTPLPLFGQRTRGVAIDDIKCQRCHTTRNLVEVSVDVGNGLPPVVIKAKSKPNWDSYDSWGGMLPFNRDGCGSFAAG